jgi:flagellar hook-associated protein 3 FlgL
MMRVTEGTGQQQFLTAINSLESSINQTQGEISSNQSFSTASENPVAAGEVNTFNQALAQSQQYTTNASTEGSTLTQVTDQLQSLRDLALEANSGTLNASDQSGIASQIQQIQSSLLALANTQNGSGDYIFGGYATQTQPFALTATGATYSGDQGTQQVQIAAGQTVATGDNGDAVFNQIKTGNGTFTVSANAANTGTGLIGATTVSNAAAYNGGTFQIEFTPAGGGAYNIVNAGGTTVSSGTYTAGSNISFDGLQIALSGTPAVGDSFTVAPSSKQSIFTTVQTLATALLQSGGTSSTALGNTIAGVLNNLDQALTNISDVQASVGGRMNTITAQQSVQTSQQTQLQTSISSLQGLNVAAAITQLDQQNTTLQAALQAFTMTQGLSLFKFIQ